jgi:hypothetical protein
MGRGRLLLPYSICALQLWTGWTPPQLGEREV